MKCNVQVGLGLYAEVTKSHVFGVQAVTASETGEGQWEIGPFKGQSPLSSSQLST